MKRFYIAILITICGMTAMAQNNSGMAHQTPDKNRKDIAIFTQVLTPIYSEPFIVVYGCENKNYDVTVTKGGLFDWNGTIGKDYGAIIDYTFLSTESYVITITNSQVFYEWRLENGVLNGSKCPNWGAELNNVPYPQLDR